MQPTSPFVVSADWLQAKAPRAGPHHHRRVLVPAGPGTRRARPSSNAGQFRAPSFFDHDEGSSSRAARFRTHCPARAILRNMPAPWAFRAATRSSSMTAPASFSAPRVWWMFNIMGVENAYLLDGGLDGLEGRGQAAERTRRPRRRAASSRSITTTSVSPASRTCGASSKPAKRRSPMPARRDASAGPNPSRGRGCGRANMPGARNLPFLKLIDNGHLRPPEELKRVFEEAGIRSRQAGRDILRLGRDGRGHHAGAGNDRPYRQSLYDGSWSEWGGLQDTPVDTGEA